MVNVAFIQVDSMEQFGSMILSAVLKQHGHKTEVFIEPESIDIMKELKEYRPDLIVFSIDLLNKMSVIKLAARIKQCFKIPIIFGGPYATFHPELIEENEIDIVGLGEGEESIVELAKGIEKGKIDYSIKGLWFKKGKKIIKNKLRNLVLNLDQLPFPDRELYYSKYSFLRNYSTKRIITSRGCPNSCSFCFNHSMISLFRGKGIYVRRRSPNNVIEEIQTLKKYPLKCISFTDDSLFINRWWALDFFKVYKRKVGLPFVCSARVDELDEKLISLIKEAGCKFIKLGIETYNPKLRNEILCKNISQTQIINSIRLLKKCKIKIQAHNMIALPGETLNDAINTMVFNAELGIDYPFVYLFRPLPGTKLYKYCKDNNLIDENMNPSIQNFEKISLKSNFNNGFLNLKNFFFIGVKFPFSIPLIKKLINFPPNLIFTIIGNITLFGLSLVIYSNDFFELFNGILYGLKLSFLKVLKNILSKNRE
jgi:anaerobic magnesium-protoporphyrin IX monomethyl ester cyclase